MRLPIRAEPSAVRFSYTPSVPAAQSDRSFVTPTVEEIEYAYSDEEYPQQREYSDSEESTNDELDDVESICSNRSVASSRSAIYAALISAADSEELADDEFDDTESICSNISAASISSEISAASTNSDISVAYSISSVSAVPVSDASAVSSDSNISAGSSISDVSILSSPYTPTDLHSLLINGSYLLIVDCETGLLYKTKLHLFPTSNSEPGSQARFMAKFQRIPLHNDEIPAKCHQSFKILPAKWISVPTESYDQKGWLFVGTLVDRAFPDTYAVEPFFIKDLNPMDWPTLSLNWNNPTPRILKLRSLAKLVEFAAYNADWDIYAEREFDPIDDFNYFLEEDITYYDINSLPITYTTLKADELNTGLRYSTTIVKTQLRDRRDAHLPDDHRMYEPPEFQTPDEIEGESEEQEISSGSKEYDRWFNDSFIPLRRRYYAAYERLSVSYKKILNDWCVTLGSRAHWDMKRKLGDSNNTEIIDTCALYPFNAFYTPRFELSARNAILDLPSVRNVEYFLRGCKPRVHCVDDSVEDLTSIRCIWVFAELLLRDSMEDEKALWEEVILLHTGMTLNEIVEDYDQGAGLLVDRDELTLHRWWNYKYLCREY